MTPGRSGRPRVGRSRTTPSTDPGRPSARDPATLDEGDPEHGDAVVVLERMGPSKRQLSRRTKLNAEIHDAYIKAHRRRSPAGGPTWPESGSALRRRSPYVCRQPDQRRLGVASIAATMPARQGVDGGPEDFSGPSPPERCTAEASGRVGPPTSPSSCHAFWRLWGVSPAKGRPNWHA